MVPGPGGHHGDLGPKETSRGNLVFLIEHATRNTAAARFVRFVHLDPNLLLEAKKAWEEGLH